MKGSTYGVETRAHPKTYLSKRYRENAQSDAEAWPARFAALVPLPRVYLTRFHGVFAPHSWLRSAVTPAGRGPKAAQRGSKFKLKGTRR